MQYKILAFVIMIGMSVWYFNYSQEQIKDLTKNISKYEVQNQAQQETIKKLMLSFDEQARLSKQLQTKLKTSEKYIDELNAKIRKHDLEKLALKKPGLIEKRINDATKKVFDDITAITTN